MTVVGTAANFQRLYDAAMGVVLMWDTEQSQHLSMPRLREALGLPPGRPTREEAQERMDAWLAVLLQRGATDERFDRQ